MKMRRKEQILGYVSGWPCIGLGWQKLQADDAKEDHEVQVEDVCYAQREAKHYAEDAGPVNARLALEPGAAMLQCLSRTIARIYLHTRILVDILVSRQLRREAY